MTLPEALSPTAKRKCWVNYSQSKIPINPKTLHNADSTDSRTWSDYQTAAANIGKTATIRVVEKTAPNRAEKIEKDEEILGVGLILGEPSGLNGIDLDHVIDDQGQIDAAAAEILRRMNSYAELSPSKHGIHILFTGECPVKSCRVTVDDNKGRELYAERRYFTFTGAIIGSYDKIMDRTKEAAEVYEQFFQPFQKTPQRRSGRTKKEKTVVVTTGCTENVQAIIDHNADLIREKLGEKERVFDNQEAFFNFIYTYPLHRFLDLPYNQKFPCIFGENHSNGDADPSAIIGRMDKSQGAKYTYHCFSENITLTIKTLVEKVGDFDSEVDSLDFIKSCLNCSISDTEWSRRQHRTIDLILDKMMRTDSEGFSILCPTAQSNIKFAKELYIKILILAKGTIFPTKENKTGDVLFYMSVKQLCKAANRGSEDKVTKWIKCFCYHKLLRALPDEEIPPRLLAKARRTAENNSRHVSFFIVPSMVIKKLEVVERQGKKWKEHGYTHRGVSYEMFFRGEGATVANDLYPQRLKRTGDIATVGKKANMKASGRHDAIHQIAIDLLREQGFFTEKQIIAAFPNGKTWGTIQIKRSIAELIDTYSLTKRKANKALKQRFSIESDGYPYIYYQEN